MEAEIHLDPNVASGIRKIIDLLGREHAHDIPFGFRSGADDFIDQLRRPIADNDTTRSSLEEACKIILNALLKMMSEKGSRTIARRRALHITGKLCFAATETGLALDTHELMSIVFLADNYEPQSKEQFKDILLILRTIGRQRKSTMPVAFWLLFLESADRGIRTLAVQNMIDIDPALALDGLSDIVQHDVNGGLVAHRLLRAFGGAEPLIHAMKVSLAAARHWELVAELLDEAGETETAYRVRRIGGIRTVTPSSHSGLVSLSSRKTSPSQQDERNPSEDRYLRELPRISRAPELAFLF